VVVANICTFPQGLDQATVLTLDSDGRCVSTRIHQTTQKYGHVLDLTLLECWGVLCRTISLDLDV
jgi:hypothetical protein